MPVKHAGDGLAPGSLLYGVRMKVAGIGLNKTGTCTLGACFRHWGLRHMSCSREAVELWRNREFPALMAWVAEYDSFEDWPWPLLYREIDQAFPGTKFILTRRKNSETWFRSLCRHAERSPVDLRKKIYGHEMPHEHKAEHIAFYESHLAAVREYFRDRPGDLLEICWEEGDGWEELATFLGLEKPDIALPHENKTPDIQDKLKMLPRHSRKFLKKGIKRIFSRSG